MRHLKKAALCTVSVLALGAPASAQTFQWSGLYVGGALGYGHTSTQWHDVGYPAPFGGPWAPPSQSHGIPASGLLIGALAGYNMQAGQFVYGVEADLSYLTGTGSKTWPTPGGTSGFFGVVNTKANWLGSARVRAGVAMNQFLIFATAGLAFGNPSARWSQVSGASWLADGFRAGFIFGGGIEVAVNPQWIVRFDVMHALFGTRTAADVTAPGTLDFGATTGYVMRVKQSDTVARLAAIFKY